MTPERVVPPLQITDVNWWQNATAEDIARALQVSPSIITPQAVQEIQELARNATIGHFLPALALNIINRTKQKTPT